MTQIKFIIQGSQAADIALEIKNYINTEWDTSVESSLIKPSTASSSVTNTKINSGAYDYEALRIVIDLYIAFKILVDGGVEVLETKEKVEKLLDWAEKRFTNNGELIWIEIGGIPYPLKASDMGVIKAELNKIK